MDNKYLSALGRTEKQFDSLYREAAAEFGLSHCAMWVLYNIANSAEPLSQQDLVDIMMFPKQTINSAVMGLSESGLVTLEPIPNTKNRKRILLTDKGQELAKETVVKLTNAELRAVAAMGEEKMKQFVTLYCEFFDDLKSGFEQEGLL